MHVVAIAELKTPSVGADPIQAEAAALAADLGTTAYEERLKLVAGLPAIVLTAADRARAQELAGKIERRGHQVFVVSSAEVVASGSMISMRRFVLGPSSVTLPDAPGEELPYGDVLGLFRGMQTTRTETRTETTAKKFDVGRAVLSGGLVMRKKVTTEHTHVASASEQVLYVFRRSRATPWILRERGTHYGGLGAALDPSSARNFLTMIARLRNLASGAAYDERLLNPGSVSRLAKLAGGGTDMVSVSSADGADLVAHLLALSFAAKQG